jgi:hypothetical protein
MAAHASSRRMIDELALIGTRKLTDRAMSPPGPELNITGAILMSAACGKLDVARLMG